MQIRRGTKDEGQYTSEYVWGRQWLRQRTRMNNKVRDKVAQLRTSRLSLRQASSVAIQITQSAYKYPAAYDVYTDTDMDNMDKINRAVVKGAVGPEAFLPDAAVHLPESMGGLGVETTHDLHSRLLVTSAAADLDSKDRVLRSTTRHVWELLEEQCRQNLGGQQHAAYGLGQAMHLMEVYGLEMLKIGEEQEPLTYEPIEDPGGIVLIYTDGATADLAGPGNDERTGEQWMRDKRAGWGVHITDEQGRELTDTNGHRLQLYGRCTGRQTSQCGELTALTLALQITQRCRRRYIVGDNLYALAEAAVAGRAGAPEEVEATRSNCPEVRALHAEVHSARQGLREHGGFLLWVHAYSHTGLPGNEAADEAAGMGAKLAVGSTKICLHLKGWQFSYNGQPATGGALHRLLWQQQAHAWSMRAQAEPQHHAAYVNSVLSLKLVGKWAKAKVPAAQYLATLKLRFGAIITHERKSLASGSMLQCPCCQGPLPAGAFTRRSDLVGHLAHECMAQPGQLRAFREGALMQWSTMWECPLRWGGLTQRRWVSGGPEGNAEEAIDSDLHALVDVTGLMTRKAGGLVRQLEVRAPDAVRELAELVGDAARDLLEYASVDAPYLPGWRGGEGALGLGVEDSEDSGDDGSSDSDGVADGGDDSDGEQRGSTGGGGADDDPAIGDWGRGDGALGGEEETHRRPELGGSAAMCSRTLDLAEHLAEQYCDGASDGGTSLDVDDDTGEQFNADMGGGFTG